MAPASLVGRENENNRQSIFYFGSFVTRDLSSVRTNRLRKNNIQRSLKHLRHRQHFHVHVKRELQSADDFQCEIIYILFAHDSVARSNLMRERNAGRMETVNKLQSNSQPIYKWIYRRKRNKNINKNLSENNLRVVITVRIKS